MINDPKFFKAASNQDGAAEFKRCIPVGVQTSFKTMAPAIATAEQLRLLPYLGQTLFDRAATYYAAHTEANATLDELVAHIQMTVVRMALWDSFDQLQAFMTDNGMADNQDGEHRLYRYQSDALRNSLQRQGYEWLNKTLEFCTTNVKTLTEFKQSPYYTERQGSMIHSMADFERFVAIGHDFTVFAKLRDVIEATDTMELPYRLGDTLLRAVKADPTTDRIKPLLRGIQGFVAHWSMADAIPFLNLQATANGLVVVAEKSNEGAAHKQAPEQQILAFAKRHRDAAERYIGQVVTYCKQHRETYPEIDALGPSESEHADDLLDNDHRKTFTVL